MASVSWNESKNGIRYVASIAIGEGVSRTINGLNFTPSLEVSGQGPGTTAGLTALLNTLISLTAGTIGNIRLIQEREVSV